MGPGSDYLPPPALQGFSMASIARAVAVDLLNPIVAVRLRGQGPVLGAAVPKAAVDENNQLGPAEDDVRPDWATIADPNGLVHPIPETPFVKLGADRQLGSGVAATVGLHDSPAQRWNWRFSGVLFAADRNAILSAAMAEATTHPMQHRLELESKPRSRARLDREFLRRKRKPSAIVGPDFEIVDLFSGCGGMTIGAIEGASRAGKDAGLAMAVDHDVGPLDVLQHSLGVPERCVEAADLAHALAPVSGSSTSSERWIFSGIAKGCLLLAGPPCQGHSALNNHTRHDDPRNDLYLAVGRVARILEPRAVIIENVRGVGSDRRESVEECISVLEEDGYTVEARRIDLSTIGVPQRRVRHVLVATIDRPFEWNLPAVAARDLRWAIGDLVDVENQSSIDTPANATELNRQRMQWLIDNREYDLPDERRPICHQSDHSYRSMYGRLRWDAPAQTITSGFGSMGQGRYVHPAKPRTLTPHEAARLQCLPDFVALERVQKRTKLAEMIGNVAPPLLTAVLVEALVEQKLI